MKKRISIKRVSAFLCALLVGFSMFGSTALVFANSSVCEYLFSHKEKMIYHGGEFTGELPFNAETANFAYSVFVLDNTVMVYALDTLESFVVDCHHDYIIDSDEYFDETMNYGYRIYYDSYAQSNNGGASFGSLKSGASSSVCQIKLTTNECVGYKFWFSNVPIYCECGKLLFSGNEGMLPSETYNRNLGYLQNVTSDNVFLTDADGNVDINSYQKKVTFDTTSTTGIDLSSGDYMIRVYGQMAFWKNGTNTLVNEDFPLVHYADYDASSGMFEYLSTDLFNMVTNNSENPYNAFDTTFGQIIRSDNTYYQIYNKTTGEYGGYTKVTFTTVDGEEQHTITTVDENLQIDNSGYVGQKLPVSVGGGTTYEDAYLNSKPVGSNSDTNLSGLEATLNTFTSTLGAVPQAIGVVFGFLPSWCLGIFGLAFGLTGIVLLYKLFRG